MVTKPSGPNPPAAEGLRKMPKIAAPQLATTASYQPAYRADPAAGKADPANKDRNASFKLPETVSQKDTYDNSFKYGGGRSAGNRSQIDTMAKKALEP